MIYDFPETPRTGRVSMHTLSTYLRETGVTVTARDKEVLLAAWNEALDETIIEIIASKRKAF